MRVLCSFPGRHGDILWALPAVRALSRRLGEPVSLTVAQPYKSLCSLISQQPYIAWCGPAADWEVQQTAPMTPRIPPHAETWEGKFLHLPLGYRGWPARPLPFETLDCLNSQLDWTWQQTQPADQAGPISDADLALDEPWITVDGPAPPTEVAVGFTDEHVELKVGVTLYALDDRWPYLCLAPSWSRWAREKPKGLLPIVHSDDWRQAAGIIRNADVFFGCCSALHVLAVALGTPVVCMEPNPHRHADIFYPLGKTGRVRLVLGGDGLPTWDARHCRETIEEVLRASVSR